MRAFLTIFLLSAAAATAQFSVPAYLPSECRTTAEATIPGATDTKIVSIACIGVKFPLLGTELDLGIDLTTGKAPMWVYIAHSNALDSTLASPYIRFGASCTVPPIGGLDSAIPKNPATLPIPSSFIEGKALMGFLTSDGTYQQFHAKYPDSIPTVAVIAVTEEAVFGFPAGTPFWAFTWMSPSGGNSPFICVVDANTGQTVCLNLTPNDVPGEDAARAGYSVFPNPTSGSAMLSLPPSLLGSNVRVEAIDVTGRRHLLSSGLAASIPLLLNTDTLAPGMWSVLVTTGMSQQVVPLVISR